jgi:hypothetical protein
MVVTALAAGGVVAQLGTFYFPFIFIPALCQNFWQGRGCLSGRKFDTNTVFAAETFSSILLKNLRQDQTDRPTGML